MIIRIITGVLGVPILVGIVYVGGNTLTTALLILSLIGIREFNTALKISNKPTSKIIYISTIVYYMLLAFYPNGFFKTVYLNIFLLTFIASNLIVLVFNHEKIKLENISHNIFAFFYISFTFSLISIMRGRDYQNIYIWIIFILAFISDTGAYFTGKLIGKKKLASKLSPNKTIEGSIGGVVCTIVAMIFYAYILKYTGKINIELTLKNLLVISFLALIGAVLSQLGDLSSSAIKREFKVKDYGNLLPGHGGVLDRFDSVLFTTMYTYILIVIFI